MRPAFADWRLVASHQKLDRDKLEFEPTLKRSPNGDVTSLIKVRNKAAADEEIVIHGLVFMKAISLLEVECRNISEAIEDGTEYASPAAHDPISLLFDNEFDIGFARSFSEYLLYKLPTDPEDEHLDLKQVNIPYGPCGKLSVMWHPMNGPEDPSEPTDEINDPDELIGKSWTAKILIKSVVGLPLNVDMAHVEYKFFDESGALKTFSTLSVECEGVHQRSPEFAYECVHHIPVVTKEVVAFLTEPMEFHLCVARARVYGVR